MMCVGRRGLRETMEIHGGVMMMYWRQCQERFMRTRRYVEVLLWRVRPSIKA